MNEAPVSPAATSGLALFDFDGTLTRIDTMFDFVREVQGSATLWFGLLALSPWLAAHRFGLVSAQDAKVMFLRWFLGGLSADQLHAHGRAYAGRIETLLRPEAVARLEWHRAQGHQIAIVSASADVWLRAWAEQRGVLLLCTEVAYDNGVFRGGLATPNCNGPEKERRVRAHFDLGRHSPVYAYGDSKGDTEMLSLADHSWFRTFEGLPPATAPATPEVLSTSGTSH